MRLLRLFHRAKGNRNAPEAAPSAGDNPSAPPILREIELWARYREDRDDTAALVALAELMPEEGRSMPPIVEFEALRQKAELAKLSQDEAPRLRGLWQNFGQWLSVRAEMILLDRLLDRDPTDLYFLRRFRDLKFELGEPVDPMREELALRADLLLDPHDLKAAHRLSRVIASQGKPVSRILEEQALAADLREAPGDAGCSIRLGTVLEDQAKPVPIEIEEAALRHIVRPAAGEGERAVRLCKVLARRRRPAPAWVERMAVAYCGQDYRSAAADEALRDLAGEYDSVLSRWCSSPGRAKDLMICNSAPKSGTHLLAAFIHATSDWRYSRLHLHDLFATVDYTDADQNTPSNVVLADPLDILPRIAPGNFVTAHLTWSLPVEFGLSQASTPVRMALIHRDPRDAAVSQMRWESSDQYAALSEGNRAVQQRMRGYASDSERLDDLLHRMLRGEASWPFLDYAGWLRWPGCMPVAFEDLYLDVRAMERGELGETASRLAEFLGADLSDADLPELHRRIFGQGPTYIAGDDKIARYKTVFRDAHYRLIEGTPIETAIEVWRDLTGARDRPAAEEGAGPAAQVAD